MLKRFVCCANLTGAAMNDTWKGDQAMSTFEKYLALWVVLCMIAGIILSQTVPGIGETIDSWQIRGISIPIGICLFLMMYPAMLNLQVSELKKLRDNPKPILLSLFSNWIVAPIVAHVRSDVV